MAARSDRFTCRIVAMLSLAMMLAGCASAVPPPRLYVLSPLAPAPGGEHQTVGLPAILVAQTQVPDYLDRPQLVERSDANELKLVDADQWAERLSLNISRVLAENLSAMVPADANIASAARSGLPFDYQVALSLNGFELDQSGAAILAGRWSITTADGTRELAAATVSLRQPPVQPGIPAAVEAMSANLGAVSRDIAAAIKGLHLPSGAK